MTKPRCASTSRLGPCPPRRTCAPAALLLLALLAPAARADSLADEADFRFRRGAQLYKQGKLEEALSEFLSSNRLVHNRNVLFNIARMYEQLKMYNEAWRAYSDVQAEPMKEADKKDLEAALARLRPQLALLEVKTDPPGATVYVNRKDLGARGQSPLVLALPAGKEAVLLELEGHKPARVELVLTTGKTALADPVLERIWGTLVVEGEPAVFELKVDGVPGAEGGVATRNGPLQVEPGKRTLTVSAKGTVGQQLTVTVPPEGEAQAKFKLLPIPPPSGAVVVKANVDGAAIKIDGVEAGFTPAVIDSVLAGKRIIEISEEGRETLTREVEVRANERTSLSVRLRYAQPRVVAAERKLTRAEDAPASITVISGDEVRGFGYGTLAEALRSVRGLYLGTDRTYEAVGTRGFSITGAYNNRVLVLNDGHTTNEPSYGQGSIGRDFDSDLSEIERIEVVRGPGSVLYGSAAFFGVVNVVHKIPPPGLHARAGATIGSLGETYGHLSLSAGDDKNYVWLRGSAVKATGEENFLSPSPAGSPFAGVAHDLDGEVGAHGDLRARLGDFTLLASYNFRKKDIPTAPYSTTFGTGGTSVLDRRSFVEANYNHTWKSGLGVDVRASYDAERYIAHWDYLVGPGQDTTEEDWVTGEVRVRLPELLHNKLFLGSEVQYRANLHLTSYIPGQTTFDNFLPDPFGNPVPTSERIFSAYVGDEIALHKRVRVNAAIRVDDHADSFGLVVNPRIALLAQPYDDGATKLIFGQAFRAPGFAERYYTDYVTTKRPENLQAERVTTGELEHTHQLTDEVSLTGAAYLSRIEQLIGFVALTDGSGLLQQQNLPGTTKSGGLEAEARWRSRRREPCSRSGTPSRACAIRQRRPIPNSVEHSGAVRLLYPLIPNVLSFASELIYGGARHTTVDEEAPVAALVGESLRWNLGLTGAYNKANVRYGLYIQNVLDERLSIPAGGEIAFPYHAVPQPGRVIRLQVAATF